MKKNNGGMLTVAVLVGIFLLLTGGQLGSIIGPGFTTLNLQEVNFISTDSILKEKTWAITLIPVGDAQWIEGSVAKSDAFKPSDGDNVAERDLTIAITNREQKCRFDITDNLASTQPRDFGVYTVKKEFVLSHTEEVRGECSRFGEVEWVGPVQRNVFTNTYGCIYSNPKGWTVGVIDTEADRIYETEVTIRSGSNVRSGIISNLNNDGFVKLGDVAYVRGFGFSSGYACPGASLLYIPINKGGRWTLASADAYRAFERELTSLSNYNPFSGEDNLYLKLDDLNSLVDAIETNQRWSESGYGSAYISGADIYFEPTVQISTEIVQLYVKADWLGIIQPVGVPKVTCLDCYKVIGTDGSPIRFGVRNLGTGQGNAEISVQCESPFYQSSPNVVFSLQPNEYKESAIEVSAETDQTVIAGCTFIASIRDKEDTVTVTVEASPSLVCSPGEEYCVSDSVSKCNALGTAWIQTRCAGAEICQYVNEKPTCVNKEAPGDTGTPWGIILLILVLGGGGYYLWKRKK